MKWRDFEVLTEARLLPQALASCFDGAVGMRLGSPLIISSNRSVLTAMTGYEGIAAGKLFSPARHLSFSDATSYSVFFSAPPFYRCDMCMTVPWRWLVVLAGLSVACRWWWVLKHMKHTIELRALHSGG